MSSHKRAASRKRCGGGKKKRVKTWPVYACPACSVKLHNCMGNQLCDKCGGVVQPDGTSIDNPLGMATAEALFVARWEEKEKTPQEVWIATVSIAPQGDAMWERTYIPTPTVSTSREQAWQQVKYAVSASSDSLHDGEDTTPLMLAAVRDSIDAVRDGTESDWRYHRMRASVRLVTVDDENDRLSEWETSEDEEE